MGAKHECAKAGVADAMEDGGAFAGRGAGFKKPSLHRGSIGGGDLRVAPGEVDIGKVVGRGAEPDLAAHVDHTLAEFDSGNRKRDGRED
jgi:hypothetical protein